MVATPTTQAKAKKKTKEEHLKEYNPEFMRRAIELSRRASIKEKSGGVFGAVVVKDGKIIAEGYNQVFKTHDPTWHAEMQAIREACTKLGTPHLEDCVLYTSGESCPMCLSAAYWAHLGHIFYASTMEDAKKYGKFDDTYIAEELRKTPEKRIIPSSQHMQEEAVAVWKEFAGDPDRVHY
jgi:tRNA(Arg) A34 adenosine deaminase TadA